MAVIYLTNGQEHKLGELSLKDCEAKLRLRRSHYVSGLNSFPDLTKPGDQLAGYRDNPNVVVLVTEVEARATGWKAGFYHARCTPEEARNVCGA